MWRSSQSTRKPKPAKGRSTKEAAATDEKGGEIEGKAAEQKRPDRLELGRRFLIELFEGREWVPRDEIGEKAEAADVSDAMLGRLERDLRIRHG